MNLSELLANLHREYLESLPERIRELEGLLELGEFTQLATEFHKLKGNGQTHGFPEVSQLGQLVERIDKQASEMRKPYQLAIGILQEIHQTRCEKSHFAIEDNPSYLELRKCLKPAN